MDDDKKSVVKRPVVLRKLNADNLYMIERGLLGDLPKKLKPQPLGPTRDQCTDLEVAKPAGILSACLQVFPESPVSERVSSSDDEAPTMLKKSFSFRDRLSRISFFGKEKEKPKGKGLDGDIKADLKSKSDLVLDGKESNKSNKRSWFFRTKELAKRKEHIPIYKRSKSFEFLPRAIEEEDEELSPGLKKNLSFGGSSDTMGEAWTSVESLDYIANVYKEKDNGVHLKSFKELECDDSHKSSQVSTGSTWTTGSSSNSNAENLLKTESVENVFEEFHKAVELFSENYLSDCEPYTRSKELTIAQKRKSSSFSNLPPKVVQATKVSEISEDFKLELAKILSVKGNVTPCRRGSATDCFVLEDHKIDENRYKRGQKKAVNRVRRMSSTKYWITPEECAVYTRDQRPPLVIPRITQCRPPRPRQQLGPAYTEESIPEQGSLGSRDYEPLNNWSPTSERCRPEFNISYTKSSADSPTFVRINKRLGGSSENLLIDPRRPTHLQLPASSSGDSLDVELRDREQGYARNRKSRSMVAPKNRVRSPVPAPRFTMQHPTEVIQEGPIKRTKYLEGAKKTKKNWIDCYMVLTPTALLFYKDQRTYYTPKVSKPPGTPPSPSAPLPELVLPLRNAHADECPQKYTKRYQRSILLFVGCDQYLIQDDTEQGSKRWLEKIKKVIYNLYPRVKGDSPPLTYGSSNTDLESLGRTPPATRHANRNKQKAADSSNEDLSENETKSHVRSRLRKFFAKRPPKEHLINKGIYKDEPVFGRNLEEVCPPPSPNTPRVPEFVVSCIKEIERSPENMCTDGLYRASGNLSQVQKIRLEVDQNKMTVIANNPDIHVLTGSLKLFFRELKEPLIPCSMFDRILAACSIKPKEARTKEFQSIIQALPQCNRDTLKYVLEHLLKVTTYSDRNRMHIANLAIVFGPTLLWAPAEQAHNIAVDCIQQNNVVEILLTDFNEIFAENGKGKKKA